MNIIIDEREQEAREARRTKILGALASLYSSDWEVRVEAVVFLAELLARLDTTLKDPSHPGS